MDKCQTRLPILPDDIQYSSLSKATTPYQQELVQTIFELEQLHDGTPELTLDGAVRAYLALHMCEDGDGYDIDCLDQTYESASDQLVDPEAIKNNITSQAIDAIDNSEFIDWIWQATEETPVFQQLLFMDEECLKQLVRLSKYYKKGYFSQNDTEGNPIHSIKGQFNNLVSRYAWNGWMPFDTCKQQHTPDVDAVTLMLARLSMHIVMELVDYEVYYKPKLQESFTKSDVENFLKSGNARITLKFFQLWHQIGKKAEDLKPYLYESLSFSVFDTALGTLLEYRGKESTNMLIDLALNGSFNVQQTVIDFIRYSANHEALLKKANELIASGDAYKQLIGKKIKESINMIPPMVRSNRTKFSAHYAAFRNEVENRLFVGVYTSSFLRFPSQLKAIANELKQLINKGVENPKITIVGGSYGAEAYSLMILLDNDFHKNPTSWNGENPLDTVEITTTDIDPWALHYAKRGQYVSHPALAFTDFYMLGEMAKLLNVPLSRYFNTSKDGRTYTVKDSLKTKLKTKMLDILNPETYLAENGQPNIVIYNMVDSHLGSRELAKAGAHKIAPLPTHALFVVPRLTETRTELLKLMTPGTETAPSYIFYPK